MLPITTLEFTIETQYPLDLGANPGASIRGALYEALAVMYDTGAIATRYDADKNPVDWLMRLKDESSTGGDDVPRAFGIRPPLDKPSTHSVFAISFYGAGHERMPLVISAVDAMQKIGLGRGRNKFTLRDVSAIDTLSRQKTVVINGAGEAIAPLPPPPSPTAYHQFANLLNPNALTVRFITPTRIVRDKHLVKTPIFRAWVQRLLGRINSISKAYTDTEIIIPFHELIPLMDSIEMTKNHTQWRESWSHNRMDGTDKPTSGFMGQASYVGNIAPLLPYILMGQGLQVGKNIVKGSGWYEVVYQWRAS
jgi:hypothetical protein